MSRLLVVIGFVLHLAVGYFYAIAGLAVPGLYLFFLWAMWGALLVLAVENRNNPWFVLATPIAAVIIYGVVVLGGGFLFDWEA